MEPTVTDALAYLRTQLKKGADAHRPKWDSVFHNAGTFVALAATTTATVLATSNATLAMIATGVATFLIALSRALNFGARWSWNTAMKAAYLAQLDRVEEVALLPEQQQPAAARSIFDELVALRHQEKLIPGSGEGETCGRA